MKYRNTFVWVSMALLGFASCEMKDELIGNGGNSSDMGLLEVGVAVNSKVNNIETKASDDEVVPTTPSADGEPMPGAADVLEKVGAYGMQRLVVTGSGQKSLIDKLEHTYPHCFSQDKMVTAFDVKYGKPDPEPYLIGLVKAGVSAHEAFVVENAPLGVRAGVAAGIFTIAVNTGPLSDEILWNEGANLLFPSMESLATHWPLLMQAVGK